MKKSLFVVGLILLVSLYVMASGVKSPQITLKASPGFSMKNVVLTKDNAGDSVSFTLVNNSGKSISKGTVVVNAVAKGCSFGKGQSYDLNLAAGENRDLTIRVNRPLGEAATSLMFSTEDEEGSFCDRALVYAAWFCSSRGGLCTFNCLGGEAIWSCCGLPD